MLSVEGSRVLIVDDDSETLALLREIVVKEGYQVQTAEHAQAALAKLEQEKPDVVITDIHMPEKDGIEMILEFRRFAPRVPILAMSGSERSGRQDVLRDAALLGVAGTIAKPFAVQDMIVAVERALQDARRQAGTA